MSGPVVASLTLEQWITVYITTSHTPLFFYCYGGLLMQAKLEFFSLIKKIIFIVV